MPYVKPSDETTEKLRGWLILNPNKPRRSTGNAPPPKDSATKPSQDPPTNGEEEVKP